MPAPYCTPCQLENPPDATECVLCGTPLPRAAAAPASPPAAAPAGERPARPGGPPGAGRGGPPAPRGPRPRPPGAPGRRPPARGAPAERPTRAMPALPGVSEGAASAGPDAPTRRHPKLDASEEPTRRFRPGAAAPGGAARAGAAAAAFAPLSGEEREAAAARERVAPTAGAAPPAPAPEGEGPILGWLTCPPFRPVPVGRKPLVALGRSRECDLILPHASVSRTHVAVRALGGKVVFEDRSSYGTWLNGKRAVSGELAPGDALAVGPYEVVFKGQREVRREQGEEETRPFQVPASSEAMNGRLERVALDEVLQQIEFYKKTGTLRVFTDDFDGILVVYEGAPMYAEAQDGTRDAEVVYRMLRLKSGNFSFLAKVEAGEMSMAGTSITALLMEAHRLKDEAAR